MGEIIKAGEIVAWGIVASLSDDGEVVYLYCCPRQCNEIAIATSCPLLRVYGTLPGLSSEDMARMLGASPLSTAGETLH